jgi:hypothetical protein
MLGSISDRFGTVVLIIGLPFRSLTCAPWMLVVIGACVSNAAAIAFGVLTIATPTVNAAITEIATIVPRVVWFITIVFMT